MNEDCIFCKIVRGEVPAEKIYEDENTLAFMDLRPVSRGHALVIPKNHSADFLSAQDTDLINATKTAQKVAAAIMKGIGASGINITSNNGSAAGQVIFHLHFHIIPRFANDGLKPWEHKESESKTRAELAEIIKKNLA